MTVLPTRWISNRKLIIVFAGCVLASSCGGRAADPPTCASISTPLSSSSLQTYDSYSATFLDEDTRHPTTNGNGQVVWGTRYYLESLLTAFEATKNPKYIKAFEDTAGAVMGLVQSQTFVNVPDPSAPGQSATEPTITTIGWPTYASALGQSISIPTASGQVALYAQSMYPSNAPAIYYVDITQQPDGTLQFAWVNYQGNVVQAYPVASVSDLYEIAAQPIIFGGSCQCSQSFGRIKATGLGLPVPGRYALHTPLTTIWHTSQSGGILLPFVRFLLIANKEPGLVDPSLVSTWRSQVLKIASEYVNEFVADGDGGYVLQDPYWTPSLWAGFAVESDYVWVETSLRMLLYQLTSDPQQLALAKGLLHHQLAKNVPISSNGWLILSDNPDFQSWPNKSAAPIGAIWDSFQESLVPEYATDGGFFVQMLHFANQYGLTSDMGISPQLLTAQANTFSQYLLIQNAGAASQVRALYPTMQSSTSDSIVPSPDPFAGTGYLEPEISQASDWIVNWQWMSANGTSPQGLPIGYFLRAWARSEAALASACPAK